MKEHVVSYFFACCVVVLKLILLILCPINLLAKDITIGVIIDGQSESTNVLISELKQELSEIAGRDFIANFDPKYQLDGEWNLATIRQQVTDLASQSDIDILLTLSVIGSQQTIDVNRSIPVIAPLVFNNTVQGFPISQQDTSGLKNLHYLTAKHDFRSEIIEFQALTNVNNIAIVIDELLIEALPHLITVIDNFFSNEAFNVHIVSINDDGWQTANHIDAVFLTSLKRLSVAEMKRLIEHINMRGLPSYSAEGKPIVSLGVIIMLLIVQFNSIRHTFIILVTIPLGLIGVVAGLLITKAEFGFLTLLGIISLSGIVINNAIVLLDRIRTEIITHKRTPAEAILTASQQRVRPILLTTATTIGGMLPLWFGGGPMFETMAIAILFGLLFATVITLLMVPVLYRLAYRVDNASLASAATQT